MEPQVVAQIRYKVFEHTVDGVIAVRFAPFGLTAYGDTEVEAVGNFKRLYHRFINGYRRHGRLEEVLNRSGVEWQWKEDYTGEYGESQQPDVPPRAVPASGSIDAIGVHPTAWRQKREDLTTLDFAVAA